jgi:hypothetical protein
MPRRALLIGAQTFGLSGVEHDVRTVERALGGRGFDDIRVCWRSDATRDGILDAYEHLIAATGDGDPVLVYFSGHGGIAERHPDGPVEVARTDRQFIVPTDFGGDGGFRGITAVELSVLLGRLTERTDNAVVVLDCCHSAMMSRDLGDLRVRQLPVVQRVDLAAHLRRRVGEGLRVDLARARGNQRAVRLAACAVDQFAYESRWQAASGACGLLTDAFVVALGEAAGTRVGWSRLVARVRHLVERRTRHQRPEAEGPAERVLFETASDDDPGSLPVVADGYRARLDGAGLLGVQVGDEFAVTSATARRGTDSPIATVRITSCGPVAAAGQLDERVVLPADARAHRTKATAPRVPVRVPPGLALDGCTFVRPAEPGEETPFTVVVADGMATVHDAIGPLHRPRPLGPAIVENLERGGRATALLSLREHTGWASAALAGSITVEWGRVVDGRPHPLANGAPVDAGDLLYVSVHNTGATAVYVSMLDVGLTYGITVLTDFAPSGLHLPPDGRYTFGAENAGLEGVELEWPDGLDPSAPRPETVLVLVTTEPHDVTVLEQHGMRGTGPSDPLTELLAHLGAGATRDLRRRTARGHFLVRAVELTASRRHHQ